VVLAVSALAAGILAPVGMWQWMTAHGSIFGNLTVRVPGVAAIPLDPKWSFLAFGLLVAISYSALAGIALTLSRSARPQVRNAITVAMLPLFFALAWLVVRSPR
jgi:hypothetical protein